MRNLKRGAVSSYVVISLACFLHYIWAALLIISPAAAHSTPLGVVVNVFGGRWQAVGILIGTALVAHAVFIFRRRAESMLFLLAPQQVILFMSAGAGIAAAVAGHYGDGVPRPWEFILGDQMAVILLAVLYMVAVAGETIRRVERS